MGRQVILECLHKGRAVSTGGSGLVSQMSDMDTMAYLVRPPTGKPQPRPREMKKDAETWDKVSQSRRGRRNHNTHRELFKQTFQDANLGVLLSPPRPEACSPISRMNGKVALEEMIIPVVPENAVQAYFDREAKIAAKIHEEELERGKQEIETTRKFSLQLSSLANR